jgi:hypothetical protein
MARPEFTRLSRWLNPLAQIKTVEKGITFSMAVEPYPEALKRAKS